MDDDFGQSFRLVALPFWDWRRGPGSCVEIWMGTPTLLQTERGKRSINEFWEEILHIRLSGTYSLTIQYHLDKLLDISLSPFPWEYIIGNVVESSAVLCID